MDWQAGQTFLSAKCRVISADKNVCPTVQEKSPSRRMLPSSADRKMRNIRSPRRFRSAVGSAISLMIA